MAASRPHPAVDIVVVGLTVFPLNSSGRRRCRRPGRQSDSNTCRRSCPPLRSGRSADRRRGRNVLAVQIVAGPVFRDAQAAGRRRVEFRGPILISLLPFGLGAALGWAYDAARGDVPPDPETSARPAAVPSVRAVATSSSAASNGSNRYSCQSLTRSSKGATRTTPSSVRATWAAALDQVHRQGIRHNWPAPD